MISIERGQHTNYGFSFIFIWFLVFHSLYIFLVLEGYPFLGGDVLSGGHSFHGASGVLSILIFIPKVIISLFSVFGSVGL